MKKYLFTALSTMFLACTSVQAGGITIDYIGDTYVTSNNVERSLIVNSIDGTSYDIAVRPLEEALTNSDNNVSIPLEYLYFNNTKQDVWLKYNEYSNIFYDADMEGTPRSITAKIKDYGIVPAGVYNIMFEVQATDHETQTVEAVTNFELRFVVPVQHELNTYSETPTITVGAKDVFRQSQKITNEIAPRIFIRSNTDWILSLDTTGFEDTEGTYYIKTTSGSAKVTSRLQEYALITPGKEIILARGKAPAENEFVTLEYSIENPDGKVIPAGNYTHRAKYILREGDAE